MNQKDAEPGKGKCNFSHLSAEQRIKIAQLVCEGVKLDEISKTIGVSKTSVSRELQRNRKFVKNRNWKKNFCKKVQNCKVKSLCSNMNCRTYCKNCEFDKNCNEKCPEYVPDTCNRLNRYPYVCDGCPKARGCTFDHYHYDAKYAIDIARHRLIEQRRGVNISFDQLQEIDKALVEGTAKGQSVEHIFSDGNCPVTARTVRKYIASGIVTTQSKDLPRGIICKPRKEHCSKESQQQIRKAKQGRDLSAFLRFANEHPLLLFSELDTVAGSSRDKVRLLTVILVRFHLFLCFPMPDGEAKSVKKVFDDLYQVLGHEDFELMFGCILTDNGSEFSDPESIEFDAPSGCRRSNVFFCHPYSSWEKGAIEVCHELLRRILPKGTSLTNITAEDTKLISSHINSYYRPDSESCAYDLFCNTYGERGIAIMKKLHIRRIPKEKVELTPALLIR